MKRASAFILCLALVSALLTGCGEKTPAIEYAPRITRTEYLYPTADGKESYSSQGFTIDASNSSEGYVMIKSESAGAVKIQITGPDEVTYTYDAENTDFCTFPLSAGSGEYKIVVLEGVGENLYTIKLAREIQARITDEFSPFLYPNRYVWYTAENDAVTLARELSEQSENDIDFLAKVYHYVIGNIKYDQQKADTVTQLVPPDIDEILHSGAGICVDYASLMAAMLRSQGIPARLIFGYSGTQYHAWINVYIPEIGWIDQAIRFNGSAWSLMDPTLAAGNSTAFVKKYTEDDSNYTVKFRY